MVIVRNEEFNDVPTFKRQKKGTLRIASIKCRTHPRTALESEFSWSTVMFSPLHGDEYTPLQLPQLSRIHKRVLKIQPQSPPQNTPYPLCP
jgi:hypothetical protein